MPFLSRMIMDNIDLINKALSGEMVIPQFEVFCGHIEEIYENCEVHHGGKVSPRVYKNR